MNQDKLRMVERVAHIQSVSHDVEEFGALFTEYVVYEDLAWEIVANGREETKKLLGAAWSSIHNRRMEVRSVLIDGDRGSMEWLMTGKHLGDWPGFPASGKDISLRAHSSMRFANGLFSHWTDYWSLSTMKRQAGYE